MERRNNQVSTPALQYSVPAFVFIRVHSWLNQFLAGSASFPDGVRSASSGPCWILSLSR
jgi:hypothetical protein